MKKFVFKKLFNFLSFKNIATEELTTTESSIETSKNFLLLFI